MSLEFLDTNSERVARASAAPINVGSLDFAAMCWVRISSSKDSIFTKGRFSGANPGWQIRVDAAGLLIGTFQDGGVDPADVIFGPDINDDVWRHVAIVRDNAAVLYRLYVDGVEVATLAINFASGSLDNSDDLLIGATHDAGGSPAEFMTGAVDDARIYTGRLVTPGEISTIHAVQGKDGIVNGLAWRAIFNEKAPGVAASGAGSVKDFGPNGLDADPVNTPTYRNTILSFRKRGP